MKKQIFLTMIIFIFNIIPVFSANVNTQQLNKQVLDYIKTNDIEKALKTLTELYKNAKSQKDYEYIIYDSIQIINNDKVPAGIRINLCFALKAINDSYIKDQKLKNIIHATQFKIINIVANANENDMIFTKIYPSGKTATLKNFHDIYSSQVEESNGSYDSLIIFACYENSVGNYFLGLRLVEETMQMQKQLKDVTDEKINENAMDVWSMVINNFQNVTNN